MFESIRFEDLNETDVREEIIAPLIRRLGYRSGTRNNVIREQSLRYPHIFIGRKKNKKDPILRGVADYILEADLKVRWVIEAKSPGVDICIDNIEQAYTYANHPEVRAVYLGLCNGKQLVIYQTNQGPSSEPILSLSYNEFDQEYDRIEKLLSPTSILENHPKIEPDTGKPIGNGLRSVVRVNNGIISYHKNSANIPALRELQTCVSGGAVERDENGRLVAFLTTVAPTRSLQDFNERMGLSSFEMHSQDEYVSSDPANPTVFFENQTITLPAKERLLDINSWQEIQLPINMTFKVTTKASGHLEGNKFFGDFFTDMNIQNLNQTINLYGQFEMYLS